MHEVHQWHPQVKWVYQNFPEVYQMLAIFIIFITLQFYYLVV